MHSYVSRLFDEMDFMAPLLGDVFLGITDPRQSCIKLLFVSAWFTIFSPWIGVLLYFPHG